MDADSNSGSSPFASIGLPFSGDFFYFQGPGSKLWMLDMVNFWGCEYRVVGRAFFVRRDWKAS